MKMRIACLLCVFGLTLTGCSIRGVTEPLDKAEDNIETDAKETLPSEDDNGIDEEKYGKVIYQVGEAMPVLEQRGNNAEDLEKYMSITITGENIYNGLEEAGIKEDECVELCEIYTGFNEELLSLTPVQYKDAKLLVLDAHIDVEDWYIDKYGSEGNITALRLSYVKDGREYVFLGYPCYFTEGSKEHPWNMDLNQKSFDVKIGYIIDEKLLNVKEVDLSKLIYNTYGEGATFKYMELFPEGN